MKKLIIYLFCLFNLKSEDNNFDLIELNKNINNIFNDKIIKNDNEKLTLASELYNNYLKKKVYNNYSMKLYKDNYEFIEYEQNSLTNRMFINELYKNL